MTLFLCFDFCTFDFDPVCKAHNSFHLMNVIKLLRDFQERKLIRRDKGPCKLRKQNAPAKVHSMLPLHVFFWPNTKFICPLKGSIPTFVDAFIYSCIKAALPFLISGPNRLLKNNVIDEPGLFLRMSFGFNFKNQSFVITDLFRLCANVARVLVADDHVNEPFSVPSGGIYAFLPLMGMAVNEKEEQLGKSFYPLSGFCGGGGSVERQGKRTAQGSTENVPLDSNLGSAKGNDECFFSQCSEQFEQQLHSILRGGAHQELPDILR